MISFPVVEDSAQFGNRLADMVGEEDRLWLTSVSERVRVEAGRRLSEPGERPSHAYFPIDALLVTWNRSKTEGRQACVQLAGRLRVAGHLTAFNWGYANAWIEVLAEGDVWRVPSDELEKRAANHSSLALLLARVACIALTINTIRLLCAEEHNIDQRLATLLLYLCEERGSLELPVTHEMLASISGIRRPSVSHVMSAFQQAGVIRTQRAQLYVRDRAELAKIACVCFEEMAQVILSTR